MQIIDGKAIAADIKKKLKVEVEDCDFEIGLAVVLVGDDGGSQVYVKNKIAACAELGIKSHAYYLPEATTTTQLVELVSTLNSDTRINGILVQLPLPKHIDEQAILALIDSNKDVDGFHSVNIGSLVNGGIGLRPCTPSGIMELIKSTGVDICGKSAVVIGRSNIVGKPVAMMLLESNATVTIAHSKTKNLQQIAASADILVVAIGRAQMIDKSYVKKGAVVIDVGTNRLEKLYGDCNFDSVSEHADFLTPVPGGVGPMTITMLMSNTILAAKRQQKA